MKEDSLLAPTTVRILSYNLWQGRAQPELGALVESQDPDVLCVQEASTSTLPSALGTMQLAVCTARNRLGLALYVKSSRFEVEAAATFDLTESRHDRLVGGTAQRLAAARVHDERTGRGVVVGSFHATPFTDSNAVRRLQVDDAHRALAELGPGLPWVMAGDYNHPILLFMLHGHLQRQGITVARTLTSTYRKHRSLVRGKFDLATMSSLVARDAVPLASGASDHKPVLFTLDYAD